MDSCWVEPRGRPAGWSSSGRQADALDAEPAGGSFVNSDCGRHADAITISVVEAATRSKRAALNNPAKLRKSTGLCFL